MRYVAGLDGGGTRTTLCCLGFDGNILSTGRFGSLSVSGNREEQALGALNDVVAHLRQLPGGLHACMGITVAAAGISNPRTAQAMERGLRTAGYTGPYDLVGDHQAALQGAVGNEGAVLIAGTGSICLGRAADGRTARAGGGGHLLDDRGSGYYIGLEMLRAVYRAADGRMPPTALTEAVLNALRLQAPGDLVGWVYRPGRDKTDTAALSTLLTPAVQAGDGAAEAIARRAAEELAALCVPVLNKLNLKKGPLAFMGGVLTNMEPVAQSTRAGLLAAFPELNIIPPRADAAQGAAELALAAFGPDSIK